ncbi:MAG TPA: TPM domain-containing protein [Limnobacter sp.]|nr:TPM domain-containing protein [Limnobacter sp.]
MNHRCAIQSALTGLHNTVAMVLMCLACLLGTAHAQAEVAIPPLVQPVVDTTNSLSQADLQKLNQTLLAFEQRKGSQIAVLLVQSTQPETIEQFGLRVAESWKVGRQNVDDGAILLLALQDKTLRIEVGYGLEGALTDIASKQIIEDIMVPALRNGDLAGAIGAGVQAMMQVVDGEPLPAPSRSPSRNATNPIEEYGALLLFVAVGVGGVLRKTIGRLPAALAVGGVVTVVAWFLAGTLLIALLAGVAALVITLFNNGRGGIGTLHGGRGGGFGGGGFRGGGGGFGGGGASGRW